MHSHGPRQIAPQVMHTLGRRNRGKQTVQKTRKELKAEYKESTTPAGVFQIRNLINGKIFIGTAQNIPGILNSNKFQLTCGKHPNGRLQADWNTLGASAFAFESLDELSISDNQHQNIRTELAELQDMWLEKLQPYDGRGYNEEPKRKTA
jgi:hypothetical protein